MPTGQAEHAHSGRIFAAGVVAVPARIAKGQYFCRIVDTGAVVAQDQKLAVFGLDDIDIDQTGTGPARILQQLREHVGDAVIEQAADFADQRLAD